jgi:hypothetical protein
MASLDRAFIDDLLSRIDIVDVIGHSVLVIRDYVPFMLKILHLLMCLAPNNSIIALDVERQGMQ